MIKGFIFDLDGVLVDTASFHFKAWKRLANTLDIDFTATQNEELKGVGRSESLRKILEWGNKSIDDSEFERLMVVKNEWYLEMVDGMSSEEILPGVRSFLDQSSQSGLKIALGSASRNARKILERLAITPFFDAIIDGTQTTRSKPDPQVFQMGAEAIRLEPSEIVVFEDSLAGIEAAKKGGFLCVGIGDPQVLTSADMVINGLGALGPNELISQLNTEFKNAE